MAYTYQDKKGRTWFFHRTKTVRGGLIQYFSLKLNTDKAAEMEPGYTIVEGPTGMPIAKRTSITGGI